MSNKSDHSLAGFIITLIIFAIVILSITDSVWLGTNCHVKVWGNDDLVCTYDPVPSMYSYQGPTISKWTIHNITAEKLVVDARNEHYRLVQEEIDKYKICFTSGKDYSYSFDIIENYNLSCKKIAYINDHLIDKSRQVDGGYISGSYSGFLSSGHVEGHLYQWVTEGVLATGQLPRNISYHLDCNNSTRSLFDRPTGCVMVRNGNGYIQECSPGYGDTKIINYYSESDFVNYYVSKCITE